MGCSSPFITTKDSITWSKVSSRKALKVDLVQFPRAIDTVDIGSALGMLRGQLRS